MSQKSKIEWTERTWNPLAGCKEVSPGCTNCYAARMAKRLEAMGQEKYAGTTKTLPNGKVVWTGKINLLDDTGEDDTLLEPLRIRKPSIFFVNSMSDLFHVDVPFVFVDKVFAVMAVAQWHTYQVLTKRPDRMKEYLDDEERASLIGVAAGDMLDGGWIWKEGKQHRPRIEEVVSLSLGFEPGDGDEEIMAHRDLMPLPNVWLGTSVEDQVRARERIPILLNTPGAVRFLSMEPLLGHINLVGCFPSEDQVAIQRGHPAELDWVIVGGESGPGARPMKMEWVRSLRDECRETQIRFFFKQWGEYDCNGDRLGKKAAGRLLDGVEHNDMPEIQGVRS